VAVISVFVYRLAMRWPVLRLRDDRAAVALLLSAGMLTLVIIYVPRIIGDGVGYYAYARSLVYRSDLVMDDTFAALSSSSAYSRERVAGESVVGRTGNALDGTACAVPVGCRRRRL